MLSDALWNLSVNQDLAQTSGYYTGTNVVANSDLGDLGQGKQLALRCTVTEAFAVGATAPTLRIYAAMSVSADMTDVNRIEIGSTTDEDTSQMIAARLGVGRTIHIPLQTIDPEAFGLTQALGIEALGFIGCGYEIRNGTFSAGKVSTTLVIAQSKQRNYPAATGGLSQWP